MIGHENSKKSKNFYLRNLFWLYGQEGDITVSSLLVILIIVLCNIINIMNIVNYKKNILIYNKSQETPNKNLQC